jgi:serine/threonine protein kinase
MTTNHTLAGEGVTSKVYHDGRIAIKMLRPQIEDIGLSDLFLVETNTLSLIGESDYIVPVLSMDSRMGSITMKFYEKTLFTHLKTQGDNTTRIRLYQQCKKSMLGALSHLHNRGIIHRDIKIDNILLSPKCGGTDGDSSEYDIRLCDFGISAIVTSVDSHISPTQLVYADEYRPPECVLRKKYTFSADIWALGIVLCHILGGSRDLGVPDFIRSLLKMKTSTTIQSVKDRLDIVSFTGNRSLPPHILKEVEDMTATQPSERLSLLSIKIKAPSKPKLPPYLDDLFEKMMNTCANLKMSKTTAMLSGDLLCRVVDSNRDKSQVLEWISPNGISFKISDIALACILIVHKIVEPAVSDYRTLVSKWYFVTDRSIINRLEHIISTTVDYQYIKPNITSLSLSPKT